jgi:hypothetical protein
MGIDLKVFASHFRERRGEFLATASLRFDRDSGLLSQLGADANPCLVDPVPVDLRMGHYEDEELKYEDVDRQGNRLTFTTRAELNACQAR